MNLTMGKGCVRARVPSTGAGFLVWRRRIYLAKRDQNIPKPRRSADQHQPFRVAIRWNIQYIPPQKKVREVQKPLLGRYLG